ncbi:MAG TPA: RNA 3'-terminal phosphate cyclase [Halobacteria archaeon]|nr:RNA 3'-terminal phosphate cyclase [Halobacteria archaeon]HIH78408.1 RNA 3'-terminal phosphate cyclase [Halobacteria archaeon]
MSFIEIDGSFGEGGGQIIRTAVALSAITSKSVLIRDIRANRPKPGLSAQHLKTIETAARLTDARVEGLEIGSKTVRFSPKKIKGIDDKINIGTAGSITLLLQCIIPIALFADDRTRLHVIGGTDVRWSPPIDFYKNVFLPVIGLMGCDITIELVKRGFYPKGSGIVDVEINPLKKDRLKGIILDKETKREDVSGISFSNNLPSHVVERQANAAEEVLKDNHYKSCIGREYNIDTKGSTGSGIFLWQAFKSGSDLGEINKRAEIVGKNAAIRILEELKSSSTVDIHLADQLMIYMALTDEKSLIKVRTMTKHLETCIYVIKKLLNVNFLIDKKERDVINILKNPVI